MAHVEKRPGRSRPYRVRYRGPDGKERSASFRKRPQAVAYMSGVETDIRRGDWTDPRLGRTQFGPWAERWLASAVHLKPKTAVGYESLMHCHLAPHFADLRLDAVDPLMVREWVASKQQEGLSPSRLRQAYQLLSSVFKAAVDSGYLSRTPCVGVKLPRILAREMLFLTPVEVSHLATTVRELYGSTAGRHRPTRLAAAYEDLIYVLAYEGIRWGECAALRRGRLHLLRSRMDVAESLAEVRGKTLFGPTKTYRKRTVVIPEFLRDRLATHLAERVGQKPDALVFTAPKGGPLLNTNFRRNVWLPAVAEAGLPEGLRIHDLRHTAAALLISQGAHPKMIQAHLGHSSIKVTLDLYGHLYPDDMERLAEGMDATWRAAESQVTEAKRRRSTVSALRPR